MRRISRIGLPGRGWRAGALLVLLASGAHGQSTVNVTVPGTSHVGNPTTVPVPPGSTVSIDQVTGTICLDAPALICTGPDGVTAANCNAISNECVCPPQVFSGNYGQLYRAPDVPVVLGTFVSASGSVQFFANGDCNPGNNSGAFQLTLTVTPPAAVPALPPWAVAVLASSAAVLGMLLWALHRRTRAASPEGPIRSTS